MVIDVFLSFAWRCDDGNGLKGSGANQRILLCPFHSLHISNDNSGFNVAASPFYNYYRVGRFIFALALLVAFQITGVLHAVSGLLC